MRRLLLLVLVSFMVAGVAFGINLNGARVVKYIASDGYTVLDSSLVASDLPSAYMFWSVDSNDDVWIRRKCREIAAADMDTFTTGEIDSASWEIGPGIKIPAGKSLVIPVNLTRTSNGYFRTFIYAGGLSDTLSYLGWDR